jgi:aspartate carbamoyltransferase catalytic subunit
MQIDSEGRLRHLITLQGLEGDRISALLDRAADFRDRCAAGSSPPQTLAGRTVVNLFFETSTRTRSSFELAARRLGAHVLNFDMASSSTSKGESLADTLATLEAMRTDAFVVRHRENGIPERLAGLVRQAAILNAGDGNHAHPTQGLLDALTIRDQFGAVAGLTVTLCGDIRHSRVARSDVHVLQALGAAEIRLCGPQPLLPDTAEFPGCRILADFDEALPGSQVVIMLRLQRERMEAALIGDEADYFRRFGLSHARLQRADANALVMHPGPMNRGVEIADDVADGPQSAILRQVANGVPVRMAALTTLLGAG